MFILVHKVSTCVMRYGTESHDGYIKSPVRQVTDLRFLNLPILPHILLRVPTSPILACQ